MDPRPPPGATDRTGIFHVSRSQSLTFEPFTYESLMIHYNYIEKAAGPALSPTRQRGPAAPPRPGRAGGHCHGPTLSQGTVTEVGMADRSLGP